MDQLRCIRNQRLKVPITHHNTLINTHHILTELLITELVSNLMTPLLPVDGVYGHDCIPTNVGMAMIQTASYGGHEWL